MKNGNKVKFSVCSSLYLNTKGMRLKKIKCTFMKPKKKKEDH